MSLLAVTGEVAVHCRYIWWRLFFGQPLVLAAPITSVAIRTTSIYNSEDPPQLLLFGYNAPKYDYISYIDSMY